MFEEKRGIAYPRTLFFAIYFYFLFNQKKINLLIYYVHVFLTHGKTATDDPFAISTSAVESWLRLKIQVPYFLHRKRKTKAACRTVQSGQPGHSSWQSTAQISTK